MADIKTQQELYDEYIAELFSQTSELTDDSEGSSIDVLGGTTSVSVREISRQIVLEFRKTFFETAHGPEITGGADDLQTLAVDHFGETFARPQAAKAVGVVTFSRPTTGAGNVSILVGTIVKTEPDASGQSQRYEVIAPVTLVGLTINASVRAIVAGVAGNALAAKVVVIETALTDSSVTVSNTLAFAGGAATQNDAEYRETIRNLIETLKGATISAVEAKAKTVAGVEKATILETILAVKEWDILGGVPVGDFFRIVYASLYIADANGTASQALLDEVIAAIESVRACGVRIYVKAGSGIAIDWSATITLNPLGPNFPELSVNPQKIIDSMKQYISDLPLGTDFNIADANLAILAIWGPLGTDDLTAFTTDIPSGNISIAINEKPIPGVVTI